VNIEKHIKTYLLNTCVIAENAKLRKNLRKLDLFQYKSNFITFSTLTLGTKVPATFSEIVSGTLYSE
jgi:hypothetical protein